jgi:hypothetical protein
MTWLIFAASVLATYAVSLMVSKLTGPGGIFSKMRKAAKGSMKEGISCPICSGVWIAGAVVAFLAFRGYIPWIECPLWLFAVSGANALLHWFDPV